MSFIDGMAFTSSIHFEGIGLPSTLHIGGHKEIHGVKLMPFAAHVHRRRLARSRDGRQIRIDVVLPESESSKDMRRQCSACGAAGAILRRIGERRASPVAPNCGLS